MAKLKLRFIKLYTRSRTYCTVWGFSYLFIIIFTITCLFQHLWGNSAAGILGMLLPLLLKKYLLEYYHLTDLFLQNSIPIIFVSIIIIPFIFGSLSHIPWPIRTFGFFYFTAFASTYFWIRTDPSIRVQGE